MIVVKALAITKNKQKTVGILSLLSVIFIEKDLYCEERWSDQHGP